MLIKGGKLMSNTVDIEYNTDHKSLVLLSGQSCFQHAIADAWPQQGL